MFRRFMANAGGRVLLCLLSTAFTLLVVETLVRSFLPRPGFTPITSTAQTSLYVPHPTRGYALAPDFSIAQATADYHITVTTNELGFRGRSLTDDRTQEHLLAVGDSFTFGFGVDGEEAWPAVLESIIQTRYQEGEKVRVLNAGVSGYSLRQIRITAQELVDQLAPRLVIVGLYPSRYWRMANPYVFYRGILVQQDKLQGVHITAEGLIHSANSSSIQSLDIWCKKHFYFGAYLIQYARKVKGRLTRTPMTTETAKDQLAPLVFELDRLDHFLKAKRIPLVVLLINEQNIGGVFTTVERHYDEIIRRDCSDHETICVNPLPALERTAQGKPLLRLGSDHHWSALAHRIAAEELATPVGTVLGLQLRKPDHLSATH